MNARALLLIVAISAWTLAACNWTIGDCYPVGERTSGAGAGPGSEPRPVYTSAGSGDFGAEPPDGRYGGSEREIACNEWELEDEEERPSDNSATTTTTSPESPRDPCPGFGDVAGDGATSWNCGGACSSKCPKPGMASFVWVNFERSDFRFVTIVNDDGTDKGGGYQQAKASLRFEDRSRDGIREWYCSLTIKMPLRTEIMGKISPLRAAELSEEITEEVGQLMNYKLPPGIFCERFHRAVDAAFKFKYKDLGASVTK